MTSAAQTRIGRDYNIQQINNLDLYIMKYKSTNEVRDMIEIKVSNYAKHCILEDTAEKIKEDILSKSINSEEFILDFDGVNMISSLFFKKAFRDTITEEPNLIFYIRDTRGVVHMMWKESYQFRRYHGK